MKHQGIYRHRVTLKLGCDFMSNTCERVPIHLKMTLTIREAAEYSNIGINQIAIPTASKRLLDGTPLTLTAYNINGNNYFKLRDLGEIFNFSVEWDGNQKLILIDTTKPYTP